MLKLIILSFTEDQQSKKLQTFPLVHPSLIPSVPFGGIYSRHSDETWELTSLNKNQETAKLKATLGKAIFPIPAECMEGFAPPSTNLELLIGRYTWLLPPAVRLNNTYLPLYPSCSPSPSLRQCSHHNILTIPHQWNIFVRLSGSFSHPCFIHVVPPVHPLTSSSVCLLSPSLPAFIIH